MSNRLVLLFAAVVVAASAGAAATTFAWDWSDRGAWVARQTTEDVVFADAQLGRLHLMLVSLSGGPPIRRVETRNNGVSVRCDGESISTPFSVAFSPLRSRTAGFSYFHRSSPPFTIRYVQVPQWALIAPPVAITMGLVVLLRRRRRSPGHCRTCGYDLRGTPDRCPECGTPAARAAAGGA